MGIKKHIPNTITCCNLVSGCIATTFAFAGNPKMAMFWIIMGAVFDFFDGMVARLLKVSSPIGKELDSLADDVTFGVAPSAIVFSELFTLQYPVLQGLQTYIPYCAFLIAAFSALRLAKFNLDDRQTTSFIGLPTPANALFWGSFIIGGHTFIESFRWGVPLILIMICLSCYLLVAEFPMFALKFKKWSWKGNEVKYIFILSCIPMLLFLGYSAFSAIIAWYVILSAIVILVNKSKKAS
ncbi:MAG: CDP-diacylglycerol--serine O-phosphatidyltransferase [Prevotella sp.]|jgi:CDP-diacylglycerol--serine O-phosphatidyltransferase|nr:CDP-diacylglycerol--serine O-phosphatidyltransferase [Prevotella sp.]MBQ1667381.1 CDP-diacylglycerol--serine O-phosphatidyltransferase [Prevotella sp.]MBQ1799902.1 CDP-diacylglycerol--serine O-phosphatidyltransferase [Prevotella sp.]MBQ2131088.1 CDP-diacylglycerol--serine O-phosphatidyltransferase [Prevotella sp.]MBQ2168861.1 CDP-diacylglycerol--serine O-phosphatidyltransferase [Prevotella sp.]